MVAVFFILGGLILLGAYLFFLWDVKLDAERRGEDGWLVALFVSDGYLNWWFWKRFRPDVLPRYREQDEMYYQSGESINDYVDDDDVEREKQRNR